MAGATRSPGMAMLHDERFVCTGFLCKRNSKPWKLVRASTHKWTGPTWATYLLTIAPGSIDSTYAHVRWFAYFARAWPAPSARTLVISALPLNGITGRVLQGDRMYRRAMSF